MMATTATGNCFEAALDYLLMHYDASLVLVHGIVSGQQRLTGRRFCHAWCERGDIVYDYSNGRQIVMPREVYYRIGQIKHDQCCFYTQQQARACCLHHETYGPWDERYLDHD